MAARRSKVERELEALGAARADPRSPAGRQALEAGLASAQALVVAAAAGLVKDRTLEGHGPALVDAYQRFLEDPVKRDPGCRAKLAVLEALDFTETLDPAPFLEAAHLRQLEPAWGPPVDTAAPCRARAVLALSRLGHEDLALVGGTLLADPEPPVRAAAADAIGQGGARAGAGALLLKLEVGDEDPVVLLACLGGVLRLAPELALARFGPWLEGGDEQRRELAALAFGQSGLEGALSALRQALEGCVRSADRAVLLRGLGLHRSDGALEVLLETLAGTNPADAAAALEALAPRRFEAAVRERAAKAVAGRPALEAALARAFKA